MRLEDLAEQVRYGYYGEEVQRLQRGRSEVKVMVRLPKDERQSLDNLRMLLVNIADGVFAPLGSLAEVKLAPGYAKLIRQDRHRVLKVQARVDLKLADINAIYADLKINAIKNLQQQFSGLSVDIGQYRQEQEAVLENLGRNTLIALVIIYALIAVSFKSYFKPLIFLLGAPVAWSGAVLALGWLVCHCPWNRWSA